jgi:hypothetical protein
MDGSGVIAFLIGQQGDRGFELPQFAHKLCAAISSERSLATLFDTFVSSKTCGRYNVTWLATELIRAK